MISNKPSRGDSTDIKKKFTKGGGGGGDGKEERKKKKKSASKHPDACQLSIRESSSRMFKDIWNSLFAGRRKAAMHRQNKLSPASRWEPTGSHRNHLQGRGLLSSRKNSSRIPKTSKKMKGPTG